MTPFYEVKGVPVHSVLLFATREAAVSYPKGDLVLAHCDRCGFIANVAFDPDVHEYSTRYESTQACSPTFNAFHRALARKLIEDYGLRGKRIVEIGCGGGEFLSLLCELGGNRGIGFDPAYAGPDPPPGAELTFVRELYSERHAEHEGDFICCKMTLEHICDCAEFLGTIRRAMDRDPDATVFLQVPDATRILRELAFWDIYYEHCSYFRPDSLERALRARGFEVLDLWTDYGDQYLMATARPAAQPEESRGDPADATDVRYFSENHGKKLAEWKDRLGDDLRAGRRSVLWGSGSKAVAFLTSLGIRDEIDCVVDVNPRRHGTFMAGTGHAIVAPEQLTARPPDRVIVMNSMYVSEITEALRRMHLSPQVASL